MRGYSDAIQKAIDCFAELPGVGKKSALRMVLTLLQRDPLYAEDLSDAIRHLVQDVKPCQRCGNYAESPLCHICSDTRRETSVVCVVENIRDLMAIENTGQYRGLYHVLGGLISPLEGVGPQDLRISSLLERVRIEKTQELIMAISPTIDGDTTIYYISNQLATHPVEITTIARGVAFGGELEYTDDLTLSRSIETRIPYTSTHKV